MFLNEGGSDSFLHPFSEKNKLSDMKAGTPSSPLHALRVERGSHSKHITHSSCLYSIPVYCFTHRLPLYKNLIVI